MKKLLFIVFVLIIVSCSSSEESGIVGKWRSDESVKVTYVFLSNGLFDIVDPDGNSGFIENDRIDAKWEAITDTKPYKVYLTLQSKEETKRIPFCVFEIRGNKLHVKPAAKGNGVFIFPENMNGETKTFTRIE